ncbi:MAG: SMI1/KNR4 family protein [Planctomycetes bacterium]|nr:SMI1/KNR4 family protein [Planctomycetota bacterium]
MKKEIEVHAFNPALWVKQWQNALSACKRLGGKVRQLEVKKPAALSEVQAVEHALGFRLPASFRQVLLEFSSGVEFDWYLPNKFKLPTALKGIFSGGFSWDLDQMLGLEEGRAGWVESCFSDSSNSYDILWQNSQSVIHVPNGDVIAFYSRGTEDPQMIYLSHDGCTSHGYKLGENFIDLMSRWSKIGCPGPEDWQLLKFMSGKNTFLDPTCPNAFLWREAFGFQENE